MSRRHLTSLCTTVVLVVPLLAFPASNDRAEEAAESDRSNRLAQESSPYLLLHADNPVDWYPRGEEPADGRGPGEGPASEADAAPGSGTGAESLEGLARRVVQARARAAGGGSWRSLEVHLRIEDGWHVNANPASEDFLIPTRVEGPVRDVVYPEGDSLRFPYAENPLRVYAGAVTLRGEVDGTAEEVTLSYQACDDERCLPPVTETLELPAADP